MVDFVPVASLELESFLFIFFKLGGKVLVYVPWIPSCVHALALTFGGDRMGPTGSLLPRGQMVLEYEGLLWLPLWWATSNSGAVCFLSVKPLFVLLHHIGCYINMNLQKSRQTKPNPMYHLNNAYFRHCYVFWFIPEKDMFLRKQVYKSQNWVLFSLWIHCKQFH